MKTLLLLALLASVSASFEEEVSFFTAGMRQWPGPGRVEPYSGAIVVLLTNVTKMTGREIERMRRMIIGWRRGWWTGMPSLLSYW